LLATQILGGDDTFAGVAFAALTFGSARQCPVAARCHGTGDGPGSSGGYITATTGAGAAVIAAEVESFPLLLAGMVLMGSGTAAERARSLRGCRPRSAGAPGAGHLYRRVGDHDRCRRGSQRARSRGPTRRLARTAVPWLARSWLALVWFAAAAAVLGCSCAPSATPPRLLAGLVSELQASDLDHSRALAGAAITIARSFDDDWITLGGVLIPYRQLLHEPACADERRAVRQELIELGRRLNEPVFARQGSGTCPCSPREEGDLVRSDELFTEADALFGDRPPAYARLFRVAYQATREYLAGDLSAGVVTFLPCHQRCHASPRRIQRGAEGN
jgi:hypothetical protein